MEYETPPTHPTRFPIASLLSHTHETLRIRNPIKPRQIAHEIRVVLGGDELVVGVAALPVSYISLISSEIVVDVAKKKRRRRRRKEATHCIKKHSVPSSGRKDRTLPLLCDKAVSQSVSHEVKSYLISWERGGDVGLRYTYKLFKAMHSFSGTTPYRQLPAQLVWSQRRIPPILRFARGLASAGVVVKRKASVVARRVYIVGVLIENRGRVVISSRR